MRKFLSSLFVVIAVLLVVGCFMTAGGVVAMLNPPEARLHKKSILFLELNGVIEDGGKFLEKLKKYREEDEIKGVLVQIDSPGGVVGPSQEIFAELKRTSEQFKKPVVVSCLGVMASGAYYAAVGADKIFVTPGCMAGSIGVIMQFANLEKLMDWAKVQRFAIKTGKFKDTGAEYRAMTPEEKNLLQELVDDVLVQFKGAIAEGRKGHLKQDVLDANADGRVFTGSTAVRLGFADQIGTVEDARQAIGEMTGLGKEPELFKPRSWREGDWRSYIFEEDSESRGGWQETIKDALSVRWRGKPMLVWPGAVGL